MAKPRAAQPENRRPRRRVRTVFPFREVCQPVGRSRRPAFQTAITVIGAGALGSWVTDLLARMDCRNLTVYDDDIVESVNLRNQLYGRADRGRKKVVALRERVLADTGIRVRIRPRRFDRARLHGIVFVLVHSMDTRRAIWETAVRGNPGVQLLVEARMGIDGGRILLVQPTDPRQIRAYEKTLYSDAEADPENPCVERRSAPTAAALAGIIVSKMFEAVRATVVGNDFLCSLRPWLFTAEKFSSRKGR